MKPNHKRIIPGSTAGTLTCYGYYRVKLLGRCIQAHRIVAVLSGLLDNTTSALSIDHIDGMCSNNTPENLRAVTNRQNQNNRAVHRVGRLCGTLRSGTKWEARVQVNGKKIYLGTYDTEQAAHMAYLAYRKQHNLR